MRDARYKLHPGPHIVLLQDIQHALPDGLEIIA
jgi:hypothetical protein